MPKPKTQKKPTKAPTRSKPNPAPVVATAPPQPEPIPTPTAAPPTPAPAAMVAIAAPQPVKPRPSGRTRRATASPAARRGADLVRFLRIHEKHAYGERGVRAIYKLALEVAHLGRLELGDVAPVAEN